MKIAKQFCTSRVLAVEWSQTCLLTQSFSVSNLTISLLITSSQLLESTFIGLYISVAVSTSLTLTNFTQFTP